MAPPTLEVLELRHLLAAWTGLDSIVPSAHSPTVIREGEVPGEPSSTASLAPQEAHPPRPETPPSIPETTAAASCPDEHAAVSASAFHAVPLDLNLDGRFDTADLTLALRTHATVLSESGVPSFEQTVAQVMFESADFVNTLIRSAYESPSISTNEQCEPVENMERREFTYFDAGGEIVREVVDYSLVDGQLHTRTSREFDRRGIARNRTVDSFEIPSGRITNRSEFSYDAGGRKVSERYFVYDRRGSVQSLTVTVYNDAGGPVFQVTSDFDLDNRGQVTRKKVHRLDEQGRLIDLEVTKYERAVNEVGAPLLPDSSTLEDDNGVVQELLGNAEPVSGRMEWNYLKQVRDAYLTARRELASDYRRILPMNELRVQGQLEQLIGAAHLSPAAADRYRRLNLYFHLVRDLASLEPDEAPQELYERYSHFVDPVSGAWQSWFVEFAQREHLALPLPPIRPTLPAIDASRTDHAALAERFRHTVGSNPVQYFQDFRVADKAGTDRLLESMRRVKAQLKMLELRSDAGAPALDLIRAQDRPDTIEVGADQIQLVTSWYFFDTDEQGKYLRDTPSEAVIRQSVENHLTNEEQFYALNIEHWPLEGEPDVVANNLKKLKYVADLIHDCNPNLLIGFYRLLPRRDPNAAYSGAGTDHHEEWQAHNDRVAAQLQHSVDVLYPSLYVLHLGDATKTTAERWTTFAEGNLREARRVAQGKPVVPFVSLYYHPNGTRSKGSSQPQNLKGWQWVEPELLLYQMLTLNEIADAFVLYNDLPTTWNNLKDAQIADAIDRFESARDLGKIPTLRYDFQLLYLRHRNELLAREVVERQLGEIQQTRSVYRNILPRMANLLTREVDQLQDQLDGMLQFWDLLSAP